MLKAIEAWDVQKQVLAGTRGRRRRRHPTEKVHLSGARTLQQPPRWELKIQFVVCTRGGFRHQNAPKSWQNGPPGRASQWPAWDAQKHNFAVMRTPGAPDRKSASFGRTHGPTASRANGKYIFSAHTRNHSARLCRVLAILRCWQIPNTYCVCTLVTAVSSIGSARVVVQKSSRVVQLCSARHDPRRPRPRRHVSGGSRARHRSRWES
eukprot:gene20771-biopygen10136